jgi:hypothetical protein
MEAADMAVVDTMEAADMAVVDTMEAEAVMEEAATTGGMANMDGATGGMDIITAVAMDAAGMVLDMDTVMAQAGMATGMEPIMAIGTPMQVMATLLLLTITFTPLMAPSLQAMNRPIESPIRPITTKAILPTSQPPTIIRPSPVANPNPMPLLHKILWLNKISMKTRVVAKKLLPKRAPGEKKVFQMVNNQYIV